MTDSESATRTKQSYGILAEGWSLAKDPGGKGSKEVLVTPALLHEIARNHNATGRAIPIDINHDRVARAGTVQPNLRVVKNPSGREWLVGDIELRDPELVKQWDAGELHAASPDVDYSPEMGGHFALFTSLLTKDTHPATVGMAPLTTDPSPALPVVQFSHAALQHWGANQEAPMPTPAGAPAGSPEGQTAAGVSQEAYEAERKAKEEALAENARLKFQAAMGEHRGAVKDRLNALVAQGKITPAFLETPGLIDGLAQLRQPAFRVQFSDASGQPILDAEGKQQAINASDAILNALAQLPVAMTFQAQLDQTEEQAKAMEEAKAGKVLAYDPDSPTFTNLGLSKEDLAAAAAELANEPLPQRAAAGGEG